MLFTFFFITLLHNFFLLLMRILLPWGWAGLALPFTHSLFVYQAVFDDRFVPLELGLTAAPHQAENPGPQSLGGEIQT